MVFGLVEGFVVVKGERVVDRGVCDMEIVDEWGVLMGVLVDGEEVDIVE